MAADLAKEWLAQFIAGRKLRSPDGRPLYGYRTSTEELAALGKLLGSVPAARVGVMLPRPEAACFCLFAAEWWRRNHEGGPWKWGGILDSVGWESVTLPNLYGPVEEGLAYWSRALLKRLAGRMFLVTLACEGGLPLKLLHQQDAWLRRYFQMLMQEFHRFRRYGTSATELARALSHVLPEGLRQEVVFELGGELAEAVWELQGELGDTKTPVAELDRRRPDWRDRFPLVVEDNTARALLNSLIEDATRIAARQVSGFSLVRSLRRFAADEWAIEAAVRVPPSIDAEALAGLMGVDGATLPVRLRLALTDGEDLSLLGLASKVTTDGNDRFVVEVLRRDAGRFQGGATKRPRSVAAMNGEQIIGRLAIPGGGELRELPWVFVESSEEGVFEMVGEGTVKTRNPDALVAVRSDWLVQVQDGGSCDSIGRLGGENRQVYRVTGTVHFVDSERAECVVRCSATADESVEYRLEGNTLPYGVGRAEVFKGAPVLVELQPNGGRRRVPSAQLECRAWNARGAWRPLRAQSVGDLALRYVEGGTVRFRVRAQVIPCESVVTLRPNKAGRGGDIELSGWGGPQIGLSDLANVEARFESQPGGGVISVIAQREVPAKVRVHFRWPDAQLDLELPFPVRAGRFLSREGAALKHESTVSVERLSGIRATVVDTEEEGHFVVEVRPCDLPADVANTFSLGCPLEQVRPREHVLDLRQLQEHARLLFGMMGKLDARVELRIVAQGGEPLRPSKLFVQRFDATFEPDKVQGEVRLSSASLRNFEVDGLDRLQVEAWPMWLPEEDPVSLTSNGRGQWRFEPSAREPGPWLIVGREGNWVRIRPTRWAVRGADVCETPRARLADIVRLAKESTRLAQLDEILQALARDPNHPDWPLVLAYFQRYQHLPAATLMLFERMVKNSDATALCLLSASEEQFDAVWSTLEQLPFLWALVPVGSWLRAGERIAKPLRDAKISERTIEAIFSTFTEKAPARVPGLKEVADRLAWLVVRGGRGYAPDPPLETYQRQMQTAQQQLMSVHAAHPWPMGTTSDEFRTCMAGIPREWNSLWRDPLVRFRDTVTNAPIAAALSALSGVRLPDLIVHDLRRCRHFDQAWFDRAYELTLSVGATTLVDMAWRRLL